MEATFEELIKTLDPKDAYAKRQEEVESLKNIMDRKFKEQEAKLAEARTKGNTERFLQMWSFAVGSAYLEHLDFTDDARQKMKR